MTQHCRLLYVVYEPGHFQVGLMLARRGRSSGRFDVVMWSPYGLPEGDRYRLEAQSVGSVYIEESTPAGGLADIRTPLSGWLHAGPARLPLPVDPGPSSAGTVFSKLSDADRSEVLRAADRVERRIRFCEDWLVMLGVDVVVFAEDNVERDSHGWVHGARRRGIRTLVISYGALSAQEAVTAYRGSPAHALDPHRADLVRRYMPHWMAEGDGYVIARLPFIEAVAREMSATAPFDPWLVNTGRIDAIAVESRAMADTYVKHGFAEAVLRPVGHPLHDRLADVARERDVRRRALVARHRLAEDRPLVLVAMPPDQLSVRPCAYPDYAGVVSAFSRLPADLAGASVVVSPHPNISPDGRALIRACGAALEEQSAADLIPLCDLYVTCVSSTIKWALACGIPILDYDCYGYHYADYVALPQVRTARDDAQFRGHLSDFRRTDVRDELAAAARADAARWGSIDGRALDRLVELCVEGDSA
jgi:hypothetical protein